MEQIFVASSFHDVDKPLLDGAETVIEAFGLRPMTGHVLGGEALTPAIQARIDEADALVGLFSAREQGDGWITHPWVLGEYGYAFGKRKPCIAIVDQRIDWQGGPYGAHERIILDPAAPHEALFRLVEAIGQWKVKAGLTLTLVINDPVVIETYNRNRQDFTVRYRCGRMAKFEAWQPTDRIMLEGGGLLVTLPSVPAPDHHIELEITCRNRRWFSSAARQFIPVTLNEVV